MPNPVTALIVAGTSYAASESQKDAVETAGEVQTEASQAGIAETQRQFDKVQELLAPYVEAGTGAIGGQEALLGLQGQGAQAEAIQGIKDSPQFNMLQKTGEESILQNAAATGGVRGGNVQGALAQYSPQILSQLIESQFGKLGQVAGLGQASAAGTGAAAQSAGANIANLYGQAGAAQAGTSLAKGQINAGVYNNLGNLAIMKAMGAF